MRNMSRDRNSSFTSMQVIVDVDTAVQDPLTNYWVLSLEKGAGQRIRRNFLYVVAFDRRGRMIDRMIRRLR